MRRIRVSPVLPGVVLAAGLTLAQSDVSTIADMARNAVQLQQSGNFTAAADAYRRILKLKPDDVATHVNLGVVLAGLGRFDEALVEYAAADKLLPGDPRIALNVALAYEKSGRLQEATARFEGLHKNAPQDDKITMLLADCYLQAGNDRRVVDLLQPIAAQRSADLGVSYMLGMALLQEGQIEESQPYLDRILRNGDTAEARFLLGARMFEAGDYPAAVKQLAGAVQLNPGLPQLQSLYGRALLNSGDPDAAAEAFKRELAVNRNDYHANLGLGEIWTARKKYPEAMPLLEVASRMRPNEAAAKLAMAECLSGEHKFLQARSFAEEAVRQLPKSVAAHQALAAVYEGLYQKRDAAREQTLARSLAMESDPGPRPQELAPEFELPDSVTGAKVRLRDFQGKRPVVLVFGSYSCPNFRGSADKLIAMYRRYSPSVEFLLVYIREAHASDNWQSTRNTREDVALAPAASYAEKQVHAQMCSRKLHLPFPAVVDGMDGKVEQVYRAWPSRVYVVDESGHIAYSSRLTELDFHPNEMEAVLHPDTTAKRASRLQ